MLDNVSLKPGIPSNFTSKVAGYKPSAAIGIHRQHRRDAPHSKVLQEAAVQIEIHYTNRRALIPQEARGKTTFRASDHPNCSVLPQEPERRLARAGIAKRRQMSKERLAQKVLDVEVSLNDVHIVLPCMDS